MEAATSPYVVRSDPQNGFIVDGTRSIMLLKVPDKGSSLLAKFKGFALGKHTNFHPSTAHSPRQSIECFQLCCHSESVEKRIPPLHEYLHEGEHCLAAGLEPKRVKRWNIWTHRKNPSKVHPMPVYSHLPDELEHKIFLIAAAEHAHPHRYLLITRRVLAW